MKLNVNIEYRTSWGESLVLCIGGKRYPLSYAGEGIWETEVARLTYKKGMEYSYEVVRDGQTIRTEWKKHLLVLPDGPAPKAVSVNDIGLTVLQMLRSIRQHLQRLSSVARQTRRHAAAARESRRLSAAKEQT